MFEIQILSATFYCIDKKTGPQGLISSPKYTQRLRMQSLDLFSEHSY